MIVSVMQPGYIPWLGFFELMNRCDVFVIYDDVDYDKGSWRNRNKIRTTQGTTWLTVPVLTKGRFGQKINTVPIEPDPVWKKKHYQTIVQNYRKSTCFEEHHPFFKQLYEQQWKMLIDLDMAVINYVKEYLNVPTILVFSSTIQSVGSKTDRLVSICENLHASEYVSANGAKPYLIPELFAAKKIKLTFQDYNHPVYRQMYPGFENFLSVIDLLFNHGKDSLKIIMSGSTAANLPERSAHDK